MVLIRMAGYASAKTIRELKKKLFFCGCAGSSLLCGLFSSCSKQGLISGCDARASYCDGFSHCEALALGTRASVVVAHELIVVVPGL